MGLKDLLVEEKRVLIDFPGCEGFTLDLAYLGKETLNKLRNKATVTKVDKKTRAVSEEIDSDLFSKLYIQAVIKGWTGLKYKYVIELIPVDEDGLPDLEELLEYSEEDAQILLKNSNEFDAWIAEIVGELQNFTKTK